MQEYNLVIPVIHGHLPDGFCLHIVSRLYITTISRVCVGKTEQLHYLTK